MSCSICYQWFFSFWKTSFHASSSNIKTICFYSKTYFYAYILDKMKRPQSITFYIYFFILYLSVPLAIYLSPLFPSSLVLFAFIGIYISYLDWNSTYFNTFATVYKCDKTSASNENMHHFWCILIRLWPRPINTCGIYSQWC